MGSGAPFGATRQSAAAPEFSLALAGTVIKARYRVNAVASVNRDVVVYSAEDLRHGRPIALKVLRDEFAADAAFVAAVRNQAGALTASAHVLRGVQRVFEFGVTETGQFFIALEWAEGATLREVLGSGGALAEATALRVAILVGEALEALHHDRLFHGHLGLDSVLMVTDGERIRLVGAELAAAYRTPMGLRLGDGFALAYRAPEQMHGGEATAASDVYALGMLLRDLLTSGRTGKPADGAAAPPLSPALERIIANALEARPDRRYPDISVMVNDMWAAQTALAEAAPRRRSDGVRPRRRQHSRVPDVPVGLATTVAAAGIVVVVGWLAFAAPSVLLALTSLSRPAGTTIPLPATTLTPVVEEPALPAPNVAMPEPPRVAPPQAAGLSPAVVAAPVPVEPPARSTAPVIDRAPRHHESVTAAQPPVTIEPPMRAAPSVKIELPVKAAPPVKAVAPLRIEPPAKAEAPAKADVPTRAASAMKVEPPTKSEPTKAAPPATAAQPAKAPPTQKEDPAADGKDGTAIIDWLLKPRR